MDQTLSAPNTSTLLLGFVTEIEKALGERDLINQRIREIYSAANADGFDKKALREVIRLRNLDPDTRHEDESIRDLYKTVLEL